MTPSDPCAKCLDEHGIAVPCGGDLSLNLQIPNYGPVQLCIGGSLSVTKQLDEIHGTDTYGRRVARLRRAFGKP